MHGERNVFRATDFSNGDFVRVKRGTACTRVHFGLEVPQLQAGQRDTFSPTYDECSHHSFASYCHVGKHSLGPEQSRCKWGVRTAGLSTICDSVAVMLRLLAFGGLALLAAGCGHTPSTSTTDDGQALVSLSVVPNDVHCLRITTSGGRSVTNVFDVEPNRSAEFTLQGLPIGPVSITGEAFAQSCVGIRNSDAPAWLSAVSLAEIKRSVLAEVELTLRRNGRANVGISFEGNDPKFEGDDLSSSVQLRFGLPIDSDLSDDYLIDRAYWVASYNNNRRVPNWVAWRVIEADLGSTPRKDSFRPDALLPNAFYKVTATDYRNSGYDRGHLCPSADRTSSVEANAATFLMSNMNPQTPSLNQGVWALFEDFTRSLVKQGKEVQVITGGVYSESSVVIGPLISVPAASFKVVVVLDPGQGPSDISASTIIYSIVVPNANNVPRPWAQYLVSVDDVEAQSGYDLLRAVPDAIENIVEAKVAQAP
jgi:endonuclease G, mitochondrial